MDPTLLAILMLALGAIVVCWFSLIWKTAGVELAGKG